jgi:membrane associated rhomboid family serine protease
VIPIYDTIKSSTVPWVTRAIIAVNLAVFVYMALLDGNWLSFDGPRVNAFILEWAFKPATLIQNPLDAARDILVSMFMHGGLEHIVGNMLFLWIFGDNVEDRVGHGRFLGFYLAGGVVAALTQALLGGFLAGDPSGPMLGASGAIGAVLGAYLMLYPSSQIYTIIFPLFRFFIPAYLYLPYWAVIQFVQLSSGQAGVALWAHIGGFLFGLIAVRFLAGPEPDFITRGRFGR